MPLKVTEAIARRRQISTASNQAYLVKFSEKELWEHEDIAIAAAVAVPRRLGQLIWTMVEDAQVLR